MILIDYREEVRAGKELLPHVLSIATQHRIKAEKADLPYGDASFEGIGPDGPLYVGIERKQIGDMLNCIDDARYSAHQKVGMKKFYGLSVLILEGVWKPDAKSGYLMECIQMLTWRPYKHPRMVQYSKLSRYLFGIQLSGVMVLQCRDVEHTAFTIVDLYQYLHKKWDQHTSLLEVQKLAIPTLDGRPSLVREWASKLDGIGVKHSIDADRIFKRPIDLARADEGEWLQVPGVGIRTAQQIVKSIWGRRSE